MPKLIEGKIREGRTGRTTDDHCGIGTRLAVDDLFECGAEPATGPDGVELGHIEEVATSDGGKDACE